MKKIPKEIIILGSVVVVLCILLGVMALSGKKNEQQPQVSGTNTEVSTERVADVEPIALPDAGGFSEKLGFEPKQVEKLSDEFVLRMVQEEGEELIYHYQTHLAANGSRMLLKIKKMTEEEYNASLPKEGVAQPMEIDGRSTVFADRILYKVSKDREVLDIFLEEEAEGKAVIMRTDIDNEISNIQTLDWYENGCRYELYADYQDLTVDEMKELAHNYFTNAQ